MRRGRLVAIAFLAVLGTAWALITPADANFAATTTNSSNSLTANGTFPTYYHQTVINNSPFLYHEMDDASGNTATDSSGNSRSGSYAITSSPGTFATATGATTGDSDGAATFGGATASGGLPGAGVCGTAHTDAKFSPGTTFTIEAWFKTSATTGGMIVNSGSSTVSTTGYTSATSVDRWLYMNSSKHIEFGFGAGTNDIETASTYNDGNWHLVDAVSNAGSSTLYIDGVSKGTGSGDTASHANQYWRVGCDDTNNLNLNPADNGFNGSLDDVAIYPTALSGARVTAHWNARTAATYSTTINSDSPTLYWRMDDANSYGEIADSSGNGNTGHYFNFASASGVTLGVSGALLHAQSTSKAATYASSWGVNNTSQNVATGYAATEEAWFKVANGYNTGGTILALCDTQTQLVTKFERIVWMDNTGKINFGVSNGGLQVISTSSAYNDGNWHMVDASVGAAGMKLYIDGALITTNAAITGGQADATAYWRWGFSPFNSWTPRPKTFYFNGSIDEIAVYNTQQADATIAATYAANY